MPRLTIGKLIILFSFIIVSIIIVFIVFTTGPKTLLAIKQMKIIYILSALAFGVVSIILDSFVLKLLSKTIGIEISLVYSIKSILSYMFLSSITPSVAGGEPILIYMLTRKDMPSGKATTITLIRGILILSVIAISAPIIIFIQGELIKNTVLKHLFYYIAIFICTLSLFIFYTVANPQKAEMIIQKICHYLDKIFFFIKCGNKLENKLKMWIVDFRNSLLFFLKDKKTVLAIAALLTIGSLGLNYSIAYLILKGLNFYLPLQHVLMIQIVLYFMLYFSPTPGGSGFVEAGGYLMFASSVPHHLIGIFIILWRFFTIYCWVLTGGIMVMRNLGFNILETLSTTKPQDK